MIITTQQLMQNNNQLTDRQTDVIFIDLRSKNRSVKSILSRIFAGEGSQIMSEMHS